MPDGDNLTEWAASSNWKKVIPPTKLSYFRNLDRGVWSRGCNNKSNQVLEKEVEKDILNNKVEHDEAERVKAENKNIKD